MNHTLRNDFVELAISEMHGWQDGLDELTASGTPLNADTASFSAFMKTDLIGPIRDGMHKGMVLLFGGDAGNPESFQGITKSAQHINQEGNGFRIPWKSKRNAGVGFRLENDRLPTSGRSEGTYLEEPLRQGYGLFNITGPLLKAASSNSGAFESAFKLEMDDTVTASKIDWNRAAFGNGSGVMATLRNNEAAAQTVIDVNTTVNFRVGEIIDGLTIATGVVIEPAREVVAVDRPNLTITVSPALTTGLTATTDGWVRASASSTVAAPNNSWNKETQGLASIVAATGTLHTISPVTYPRWAATTATVGGALADIDIHNALDNVGFETGVDIDTDSSFVMVTTRGIRSRYAQTLTPLRQFTNADVLHLRGGFKVLDFDGRPMYTDDQCPVGKFYGLSVKNLFWAEASDWEWMDDDGAVLARVPGFDKYEAVLYKYANLGTDMRSKHFLLDGITDDVR
jgi:hypothetical protein